MVYQRTLSYDSEQSDSDTHDSDDTAAISHSGSETTVLPTWARRTATWKAYLIMFDALLAALAICIAHHAFLSVINGRNVEDLAISQTWIRDIGNALAWIVQFLLQLSVGVALTQSIWLYVRENWVTLNGLDVLFSLPSFSILPSTPFRFHVLYILSLAMGLQALSLVGIFAPNALSVVPADPRNSSLSVPIPALDRIPITTSSYILKFGYLNYYMSPSSSFQRLARGVLDGSTILPWSPPSGCGRGCSYDVLYWGPALKCSDIPQSSIDVFNINLTHSGLVNASVDPSIQVSKPTHFLEGPYVYNATTSLGK